MSDEEIRQVSRVGSELCGEGLTGSGARTGLNQDAQMDHHPMQCHNGLQHPKRHRMGRRRCERPAFLVLIPGPYGMANLKLSGNPIGSSKRERQAAEVMTRVRSPEVDDASTPSAHSARIACSLTLDMDYW